MKVVQINSVCGSGSTGKICVAVSELLTEAGVENYILYASGSSSYPASKRYMSAFEIKWQALKSRIFGNYGFQSKSATKRLIKELDQIFELSEPDVIKNLVAILKQYGCRKDGNNIVIDCTPKNIHINLSYLIQAISFMLNMKIFYV